jgi:hypothetical protein
MTGRAERVLQVGVHLHLLVELLELRNNKYSEFIEKRTVSHTKAQLVPNRRTVPSRAQKKPTKAASA